jgi:hypothetical protein
MQGTRFAVSFHVPAALAANVAGEFTLPFAASLMEVCFSNSAADATIDVGTSADTDGIIDGGAVGDSGVPAVFAPADFNGALCDQEAPYHMANDTVVKFSMDYDGASGTAAEDVTVVFWFTEG